MKESMYRVVVNDGAQDGDDAGPILCVKKSFGSLDSVCFREERSKQTGELGASSASVSAGKRVLIGTDSISDYTAEIPVEKKQKLSGIYGRYLVAVVNRRRDRIVLHECPVVDFEQRVRASEAVIEQSRRTKDMRARNELGEAFGTKKRKQTIRAIANNQIEAEYLNVNASKMLHDTLSDKFDTSATVRESSKAEILNSMPLPPFQLQSETVDGAYPLSGLLPEPLAKSLPLAQLLRLGSRDELEQVLSKMRTPPVLAERLHNLLQNRDDKAVLPKICLLLYLVYLFRFKSLRQKDLQSIASIGKQIWNAPASVLQFFCDTFTESANSSDRQRGFVKDSNSDVARTITPFTRAKLTSFILALLLHYFNFTLDFEPWTKPLGLTYGKVGEHLKVMGCVLQPYTKAELSALGYDGKRKMAKAILRVPLKIQVPSRGSTQR